MLYHDNIKKIRNKFSFILESDLKQIEIKIEIPVKLVRIEIGLFYGGLEHSTDL